MSVKTKLDVPTLQKGLHFMLDHDAPAALCMVRSDKMRMVIAHDAGFMLSWAHTHPRPVDTQQTFAIPVSIAKMLDSGILANTEMLSLETHEQGVRLLLQGSDGTSELRWQRRASALDALGAPRDLEPMLSLPPHAAEVSLAELSDIILQAFSQPRLPDPAQSSAHDTHIAIAPVAPTISVDGKYLGQTEQEVAYFDLHALAGAVELVGGASDRVRVHVNTRSKPFLIIAAARAGARVQCIIKAQDTATQHGNGAQYDGMPLPAWQVPQETVPHRPSKDPVPLEPGQLHNISRQNRPLDAMRTALLERLETPSPDAETGAA